MDNGNFILCRKCGAVHHVTAFDKAPAHAFAMGEAHEIPADDWRAFMDQHAGHGVETLKAVGEQYFPGGSSSDPMAVAYLKVANGHRKYLLRRSRQSIDEPLRFERVEASLGETMMALEIQERELRKELKLRFRRDGGEPLSDAKIDIFIALFRAAASQVDAGGVSATEPSYANDNIAYAALETRTKESLLKQCAGRFTAEEGQALRQFIEAHSQGSDVMTLVLRRQLAVAERLLPPSSPGYSIP